MLIIKLRREAVVNRLLILVEPCLFLVGKHIDENGIGEYRAECEVFEGVIWSEGYA